MKEPISLAETSVVPAEATDFDAVVHEHARFVFKVAYSVLRNVEDAEDAVQETFLRAYQNWHTYRRSGDCRRWLFTICRHVFLRDRKRATRFVAADDAGGGSVGELPDGGRARGIADLFDRLDIAPACLVVFTSG